MPQNFSAVLINADLFGQAAPSTPVGSYSYGWTITNFFARVRVRTCTTPSASESTIYFGIHQQQQVQGKSNGTILAQKEFTLTFTCPYAAYRYISFFVEPMYGDYYSGMMRIAQGPGMARGVAVRLEYDHYHLVGFGGGPNRWRNIWYRTDVSSNTGYDGKYELVAFKHASVDPTNEPPRQQQVKFRASLVRTSEPVVAGQIKAAALIHIRYN